MKTKTILTGLIGAFVGLFMLHAQTNEGFNFKALVADNGNPLTNAIVSVKVTIKYGSTTLWQEEHTNVHTDANGIFSIIIGEGNRLGGSATQFKEINWRSGNVTYTVEVDTGSGYQTLINQEEFKYVPYAKSAEKITGQQDKLGVGDMPNTSEIVRFRVAAPTSSNDVLDLEFGAAPSSGVAQFIECNLGGSGGGTMFKVDHNGDIYTRGELHTSITGDADMKPYIYGAVNSDGTVVNTASTGGFTVTHNSTGVYQIQFSDNTINSDDYIVLVTNSGSYINSAVSRGNGSFTVFTRDTSTDSYSSTSFQFIVFKK